MTSPDTPADHGFSADEAARALEDAFGGHGEHGRDIPRSRRRVGETDNRRAPTFDDDPDRRAQLQAATEMDRETYMTTGYAPVSCTYCGARVQVRKNSEKHTSIQWDAAAVQTCPLRSEWRKERDNTCPRMRQTVKHAYAEGLLSLAAGVDPADEQHMVNPLLARPGASTGRPTPGAPGHSDRKDDSPS